MERFRAGLVVKAHRFLYHSTLGSRVIQKKKAHLGRWRHGLDLSRVQPNTEHPVACVYIYKYNNIYIGLAASALLPLLEFLKSTSHEHHQIFEKLNISSFRKAEYSERKHGLSTQPFPVSAYVGSSNHLKGHRVRTHSLGRGPPEVPPQANSAMRSSSVVKARRLLYPSTPGRE